MSGLNLFRWLHPEATLQLLGGGGWGLHWFQDVSLPSSGLGFTGFLLPEGPMAQRDTKRFCG